jgi:hypothetical protein
MNVNNKPQALNPLKYKKRMFNMKYYSYLCTELFETMAKRSRAKKTTRFYIVTH